MDDAKKELVQQTFTLPGKRRSSSEGKLCLSGGQRLLEGS